MSAYTPVTCPFCRESDFDLIGLKRHLLRGWCPMFDAVDTQTAVIAEATKP